jgi:hypothetical protein
MHSLKNIFMTINKAKSYYIVLFSYAITFASCHAKLAPAGNTRQYSPTPGNTLNKRITDENGFPELMGACTRAGLLQAPFNSWFVKNYDDYSVDSVTAGKLRTSLAGKRFRIFMGTWCGDSRREVPRIFKILDYCGIDSAAIQLVMVSASDSTYKQSPGHEERGLDIFRVPDLIVLDQGREIGRIVESPVSSLEKDLFTITRGETYTPHYPGAGTLVQVFRKEKIGEIEKDLPALAARIKPLVKSPAELNVYARVMRTAGETRKASIILQINALIFPDQK